MSIGWRTSPRETVKHFLWSAAACGIEAFVDDIKKMFCLSYCMRFLLTWFLEACRCSVSPKNERVFTSRDLLQYCWKQQMGTVSSLPIWLLWGSTLILSRGGEFLTYRIWGHNAFNNFAAFPFPCYFRVMDYQRVWEVLLCFSDSLLRDEVLWCHQRAVPVGGHFSSRHKPDPT